MNRPGTDDRRPTTEEEILPSSAIGHPSAVAFFAAQHTSIPVPCSILEGLLYQFRLIFWQLVGQFVYREPGSFLNLKTELLRNSDSLGHENYLDLQRSLEGSRRKQFQAFNLEFDFFTQLASERFLRLFTGFNETAGHSPTGAGTKAVFEQQHAAAIIGDNRSGRNREPWMGKS